MGAIMLCNLWSSFKQRTDPSPYLTPKQLHYYLEKHCYYAVLYYCNAVCNYIQYIHTVKTRLRAPPRISAPSIENQWLHWPKIKNYITG